MGNTKQILNDADARTCQDAAKFLSWWLVKF